MVLQTEESLGRLPLNDTSTSEMIDPGLHAEKDIKKKYLSFNDMRNIHI